ncbi:hypothetical protein MCEMSE15_00825 [Fimbriimonadaceae bacterium]
MNRAVFTLAFGAPKYAKFALGLGRSLRLIGDSTRRIVVTNIRRDDWQPAFDEVVYVPRPENPYHAKFRAFDYFDADAALFIDADSLVFRRLDPIWKAFAGQPIGVQGWTISHGDEWHGDISKVLNQTGFSQLNQFNGGLVYYENSAESRQVLDQVEHYRQAYDQTGFNPFRGHVPDETCLSLAIAKTGLGLCVPDRRDYMNTGVGLIGELRMNIRRAECSFVCRRRELRFVRPYVFHAHLYSQFLVYWKQLKELEKLEAYEKAHPFGWMPPGHKLRRSIERRILKSQGRI